MIACLNWAGLSAVGRTLASFNDTESSEGNTYTAGSLDFSLSSPSDFFPPTAGGSNQLRRDISVLQEGSLIFEYRIRVGDVGGGSFCEQLNLSANLDDGDDELECPTSSLAAFSCDPFEFSGTEDNWQFVASLPEGVPGEFFPESCEFNLTFEAWQTNLPFSSGFSDEEEIENKITKYYSSALSVPDIVINEFLPDPMGDDDALSSDGEWVELYNKGNATTTLTDWYLSDLDDNQLPIPPSAIAPKGFLVLYLDGTFSPEWLNNDGDVILLWIPKGLVEGLICYDDYCMLDAYFYTGDKVFEGKSFARIPDGSEIWYDPVPTPGIYNKLSKGEIMAGLQPEIVEFNQAQLFQQFVSQFTEEIAPVPTLPVLATSSPTSTDITVASVPYVPPLSIPFFIPFLSPFVAVTGDVANTTSTGVTPTTSEDITTTTVATFTVAATTTEEIDADEATTTEEVATTTVATTTDEEINDGEATTTEEIATTTEEIATTTEEVATTTDEVEPGPEPASEPQPAAPEGGEPRPESEDSGREPEAPPVEETPLVEEPQPVEEPPPVNEEPIIEETPAIEEEPIVISDEGGDDNEE